MITSSDVALAGKVNKTHGVNGELSISFYSEGFGEDIAPGTCLFMDIDGIYTPFFVASVRPRSSEALLIAFDDVDSQEAAAQFVGKSVYLPVECVFGDDDDDDDFDDEGDGFYAAQLIGFSAYDGERLIGTIDDIDDSTENALFIIAPASGQGQPIYVPIADEFITNISATDKTITFDLPEGLLQI